MDTTRQPVAADLTARGLSKEFFRKGRESARYFAAVEPCDITLRPGEVAVLMGRSGSGKTTLLNMLAGLLEPTSGTVEALGCSLYELGDGELSKLRNRAFGVIPQGVTAVHSLSVADNVKLPLELYRNDPAAGDRARALLEPLGMWALADSFPNELSGGELKRMSIARALACEPAFVFADEPTGDLDGENTETVLDILRAYADDGNAVLMVTHDQAATRIADRMLRMDAGHLEEGAASYE